MSLLALFFSCAFVSAKEVSASGTSMKEMEDIAAQSGNGDKPAAIIIKPPTASDFHEITVSRDTEDGETVVSETESEPEPDKSMKRVYWAFGGAAAFAALLIAVIVMRKRAPITDRADSAPEPTPLPAAEVVAVPAAEPAAARERTDTGTMPGGVEIRLTAVSQTDDAQYVVRVTGRTEIGRSEECQVSLSDDASVSSKHCELSWSEGVLRIRDLGSANGTSVNGVPIKGTYTLKPNDVIGAGRVSLRLGEIRKL
ncbi:hypothetical protein FACS1894167_11010 [Synergistales bacterium]|nr:hypothetical protein FACS1894167_11010 [Synergistales bacterium]